MNKEELYKWKLDHAYLALQNGDIKLSEIIELLTSKEKLNFEVGIWYKSLEGMYGLFSKMGKNNIGFYFNKTWSNNIWMTDINGWKKADLKEVEKLLLEEAKRRYPIGTYVKTLRTLTQEDNLEWILRVDSYENPYQDIHEIWFENINSRNPLIYYKGKWAEVINIIKKNLLRSVLKRFLGNFKN